MIIREKKLVHTFLLLAVWALCANCNPQQEISTETSPGPCRAELASDTRGLSYETNSEDLNRLQNFFSKVLEANRKQFAGPSIEIKGFGAGSAYPQLWLRDSSTIIPVARYNFSVDHLKSWLEEHLRFQQPDGQLYDWIAPGAKSNFIGAAPRVREVFSGKGFDGRPLKISADKNTTESDQEPSAVNAAYQVFNITGDGDWLRKKINDRPLIDRLNDALEYLLKNRIDSRHELITSALTADWGDVSTVYPDQRAIYLDERTPLVVGIYTNAMFFNAAQQLAELHRAVGNPTKADYWDEKSARIKSNINKYLWQEDKGFYRIHLVLKPELFSAPHDNSNIFAMGGNAVAVLFRVADDAQARRIFEVASKRKQEHGVSTIAGTLIPPFPRGYFKHPAVSEEYVYQNGGQWDWFAGRLLLAQFERGASQAAYRELIEVGKKAVQNNGLHEWHTLEGEGKGSRDYAGSAGVLGGAISQGLFGVYLNHGALTLKVRLSDRSGSIRVHEPATDRHVSYQYCYEPSLSVIRIKYSSNFPNPGRIHILLPQNKVPDTVVVDDRPSTFEIESVGDERYLVLATDWSGHTLQIRLQN